VIDWLISTTRDCTHCSAAVFHCKLWQHEKYGSFGPPESTFQTASRSVQPFWHSSRLWSTNRHTHRPRHIGNNRPHIMLISAPIYLSELCMPVAATASRSNLHSAMQGNVVISYCRTKRYGQRSFAYSGLDLRNSLPLAACDPSLSLTQFCAQLKTVVFSRAQWYSTSVTV